MGTNCDMPVTCSGAVAPANGSVSASSATFGNSVTYSCDMGYTLNGTAVSTCQADGTFATPAPTCSPSPCSPNLVAPANGSVTPTMGTTGTVATYSCNGGYALNGNATTTCQADGMWSGTAPTCTLIMTGCTPDPCVNSMTGCMPVGATGYTCGTCDPGWTGTNCSTPVTCSGATAPANGSVSASSATFGNTVTYTCDSGYTLMGNATATCQANGTFTGPAPTCAPVSCGAPPVVTDAGTPTVSGGAGGGNSDTFGATAAYTCNTGYTLNGANPTCGANGMWGAAPTCAPINCGTPPVVANAGTPTVSGGDGGGSTDTYGATAAYTCNTGFTKNGTDPTCGASGAWGTAPTCTSSSCGKYTDVIYHISGTFTISQAPIAAADGTENVGTHPNTPKFQGAGDTSPFSTATFTQGMVRLRFTNDATGNPTAGPVWLVEQYFPIYFTQTVSLGILGSGTLTAGVDASVGMLASGTANCGAGGTACTNVKPTISRPCTDNASGTLAGTTITWGACAPVPNGMTSWNYANGEAAMGAGCATGFSQWGNVQCSGSGTICGAVPAAELGDSFQTWNQILATATFSSTNYKTATFTMPAVQIPNATNDTETQIAITKSTVVTTVCGSTPGTDLVCNIQ
jgi:hypothetical protein